MYFDQHFYVACFQTRPPKIVLAQGLSFDNQSNRTHYTLWGLREVGSPTGRLLLRKSGVPLSDTGTQQKKEVSDSPGLGLVNSVVHLPDVQVMFF